MLEILLIMVFGVPIAGALVATFLGLCWMDAQQMKKEAGA